MGIDLREGKVTLPLISLLDRCTAEEQNKIATVAEERAFHTVAWEDLLEILRRYKTPDRVKEKARSYFTRALQCLEAFPDSPYKRALVALPDLVIARES